MGVLYVSFGSKVRPETFGALPWVVQRLKKSETGLRVFGKLCPVVFFFVVCKCSSVLLQSILMSYEDCGDDG